MKYCPTCETRFDEDVMRFCTKDGTPLIDEEQPNFIGMPSESLEVPIADEDDAGDVTVVRRNVPVPVPIPPAPRLDEDYSVPGERSSQRIVVPMTPTPTADPIRNRMSAAYYAPPRQNTFKVVVLTILGTLVVLGLGGGLLWLLQRERTGNANVNINANLNANQNANLGLDTNFNFNMNSTVGGSGNFNSNISFNANLRTPTPSPTPTPTPRPTPTPTATPESNVIITPATPRPSPTFDGRPRTTPTPPSAPTPRPTPHTFSSPN